MLQHTSTEIASGSKSPKTVDVTAVIKQAYDLASQVLSTEEEVHLLHFVSLHL